MTRECARVCECLVLAVGTCVVPDFNSWGVSWFIALFGDGVTIVAVLGVEIHGVDDWCRLDACGGGLLNAPGWLLHRHRKEDQSWHGVLDVRVSYHRDV